MFPLLLWLIECALDGRLFLTSAIRGTFLFDQVSAIRPGLSGLAATASKTCIKDVAEFFGHKNFL